MHELPIIKEVLNVVFAYAKEQGASKINAVALDIGEFHDLIPELVEKYFRFAVRGTPAQDASLEIGRKPIICRCDGCGTMFVYHLRSGERTEGCPDCGSPEGFTILTGKELEIRNIEITC
jgi:hydrogenase nickel incorporation protein HypA/HybF